MATHRPIKTLFQFIIPLIISAGLCYILYSGMDWSDVRAGLAACRWEWMGAWAAANVLAIWFRALRWRMQLRVLAINPPGAEMFRAIAGTYAVNLVLPRLGEIWRSGYVARRRGAPFTSVFGSMIADRLSDTAAVLLITALTVLMARAPMARFMTETDFGRKAASAIASPWAIATGACIILFILAIICLPRLRFISRLRAILANAWSGFASIFHMRRSWLWLLLTAGVWTSYFAGTWFSFLAFDSTAAIVRANGPVAVLVTFVFGSWAMAVPSNGGIGPWQMAVVLALSGIYAMDRGPALAFATIVLALQTLLFIILGLYALISIALAPGRSHTPAP
ncbi:MAG: flippase-like domain-containing protein [Muribaculaceae bacterium]|nr:flippase-like domain-containing protein [Muribaculaceae bacterium]MDE6461303.1 flippase-like domain-containing protein [Muribaculaceae bacterium]